MLFKIWHFIAYLFNLTILIQTSKTCNKIICISAYMCNPDQNILMGNPLFVFKLSPLYLLAIKNIMLKKKNVINTELHIYIFFCIRLFCSKIHIPLNMLSRGMGIFVQNKRAINRI